MLAAKEADATLTGCWLAECQPTRCEGGRDERCQRELSNNYIHLRSGVATRSEGKKQWPQSPCPGWTDAAPHYCGMRALLKFAAITRDARACAYSPSLADTAGISDKYLGF